MNKKQIILFVVVTITLLVFCATSIAFGVLVVQAFEFDSVASFGDAVAIVRVEGTITGGNPPTDLFGNESTSGAYSNRIIRQLKEANEDTSVKAVVLYVDSPGGGVVASDEIYMQMTKMEKPVVVSMGTLAASGGYYISAPAEEIWANRNTLTGSIGVIAQFINIDGFMDEYGIEVSTIKSGVNKDTGSMYRDMTSEEEAIWQELIDEIYYVFVDIVVEEREIERERVLELADGRIYTGSQAKEVGLIDKLGGLEEATNSAAELGGIKGEPRIVDYFRNPSALSAFSFLFHQPSPSEQLQELLNVTTNPVPMYLYTGQ